MTQEISALSSVDPSASVHAETLGQAESRNRLRGRRIMVVGAGQRATIDAHPPIGNGRAIATLCAREGAIVACVDNRKDAAEESGIL